VSADQHADYGDEIELTREHLDDGEPAADGLGGSQVSEPGGRHDGELKYTRSA
jgi:hypothetical protein